MRQITRNGPLFEGDIQVCDEYEGGQKTGYVFILNRRTKGIMSNSFKPTAENIESVMKQCFESGQEAKAREIRGVLGVSQL